MENTTSTTGTEAGKNESILKTMFAAIVIPVALVAAIVIFKFVMGNGANFEGGDPNNNPLAGNYLGVIYKGGFIVPILLTLLILVITFSIERFITIRMAEGKGNLPRHMRKMQALIATSRIDEAITACNEQRGTVSNVLKSVLEKYSELEKNQHMDKEQKVLKLQLELEDATELELPMLEKNLTILATIASISTLMGLLGTVLGMIRSFAALAHAGAPDSVALATGISEALINTAFGIATSALAIVAYNYFTSQIDSISYHIDEAGLSVIKVFNASYHDDKKQ